MNDKERIDELEKRLIELAELVNMLEDTILPLLDEILRTTRIYIKQVEIHNQLLTQAFWGKRPNEN